MCSTLHPMVDDSGPGELTKEYDCFLQCCGIVPYLRALDRCKKKKYSDRAEEMAQWDGLVEEVLVLQAWGPEFRAIEYT